MVLEKSLSVDTRVSVAVEWVKKVERPIDGVIVVVLGLVAGADMGFTVVVVVAIVAVVESHTVKRIASKQNC